jgi:hypothetical protein
MTNRAFRVVAAATLAVGAAVAVVAQGDAVTTDYVRLLNEDMSTIRQERALEADYRRRAARDPTLLAVAEAHRRNARAAEHRYRAHQRELAKQLEAQHREEQPCGCGWEAAPQAALSKQQEEERARAKEEVQRHAARRRH